MAAVVYKAYITNDAVGSLNPAICTFTFDDTVTPIGAEVPASIAFYLMNAAPCAINSRLTGIDVIIAGSGGATPVAFPTADYATILAANAFGISASMYGVAFGAGACAPLGSSVTVSLYTAIPGRKTTGRHYLPYVSEDVNVGAGILDPAYVAGIEEAYRALFLGTSGLPTWSDVFGDLGAAVNSAVAGLNQITAPKVSTQISNLHSRRR